MKNLLQKNSEVCRIGDEMRGLLIVGVVVLILSTLVVQGRAMQKDTSIPGLFFPSATPTRTNTPTNTMTPTVTLTPTRTQTPTPDPVAMCAERFRGYYSLQNEYSLLSDGVKAELNEILTEEAGLNVANVERIDKLVRKHAEWASTYLERLPTGLETCSKTLPYMVQYQLDIMTNYNLQLIALKAGDLNTSMAYIFEGITLSSNIMPYATELGNELKANKTKYPQYLWP